jgi:ribosomal protein S27AE
LAVLGALDLFYVSLALIVVVIVVFIVRAVRLTHASLAEASRQVSLTNPGTARVVVDQIRRSEVRCPRCGSQTFTLLGTESRYQCESCEFVFEGPAHIPGASPQGGSLHPL